MTTLPGEAVELRTGIELSPTQRGMLAAHVRNPDSPAQNTALRVTFSEPLDAHAFAEAFEAVVLATDSLRLRVVDANDELVDLSKTAPTATSISELKPSDIKSWTNEMAVAPLDLSQSCYRSAIAAHPDGTATWILNVHHIATDAVSSRMIIDRTVAAYAGEDMPQSSFFAHTRAQARQVRPAVQNFWHERERSRPVGRLYSDHEIGKGTVSRSQLPLSGAALDEVENSFSDPYPALTRDLGWATFLLTATAALLVKVRGTSEFAIGVPVHHRRGASARELIGPLMGVYPLDVEVRTDDTFQSLHKRVTSDLMKLISNAHPGISPPSDYDVVVNVILAAGSTGSELLPLTTEWLDVGAIDPGHVLRVLAYDYAIDQVPGRTLAVDVRGDSQRCANHLSQVIEQMVLAPGSLVGDVTLSTPEEVSAIVSAEKGELVGGSIALLPQRLRDSLEARDDVVIEQGERSFSGQALWRKVVGIAQHLDRDAPAACRVGIEIGPSIEAVAAIYATLISGRSFVPLDPSQPADRRTALLAQASLGTVLDSSAVDRIEAADPAMVVTYSGPRADPDSEAYLLFTSGSSGQPKGVAITHAGIAAYIQFALDSYFGNPSAGGPVAPLFTSLSFDLTLTTLFAPILKGGRLVAFDQSGPAALPSIASRRDLTWCKATPSHLRLLLALDTDGDALAFDTAVIGGEALTADLTTLMLECNPAMNIFNEYGPTEAVVGCMIHRVDPHTLADHGSVSIGTPAPGVELRVVDADDRRVAVGVAGELLIASPGLFAGYLVDEKPDRPFVLLDGTRFYRSGDLVVRDSSMQLTYVGRVDDQLKVGGIRVDPHEIESALQAHPAVERAVVRLWSPADRTPTARCARCGLPDSVPGADLDSDQICSSCHAYDAIAPTAQSWFRTETDLQELLASRRGSSNYDCLSLLSGGKDSTYALHRLVDLGFRPYVFTLDNGFLSEQAKENCRRVTADLGLDHEFATSQVMNDVFRESLAAFSDVCHGCFKTIYTLAAARARELNIPALVTGLSRGQLFQTRLVPEQFGAQFDPEAIDQTVIEARKRYHRSADPINRLLDTSVFDTDDIFDELAYIDFYRYVDVPLNDMLTYLEQRTAWRRPDDTGRSTNCLINVAGISTHQHERGYHNYAEPYAWDVRLGHKTRAEAIAELDDEIDAASVDQILETVGYTPTSRQTLTAWVTLKPGAAVAPTPGELRALVARRLPNHAVPAAYLSVEAIPTTKNGKVDTARLPSPELRHRASFSLGAVASDGSSADTEVQRVEGLTIDLWKSMFGFDEVGADDDFFALGGDSLAALQMVIELSRRLEVAVPEELAFSNTTPRSLAAAVCAHGDSPRPASAHSAEGPRSLLALNEAPPLSPGEQSILFDSYRRSGEDVYIVTHTFHVSGPVDPVKFETAVRAAAAAHEPLQWSFGEPRRKLAGSAAVTVETGPRSRAGAHASAQLPHTLVDPINGPLLRCVVEPLASGETAVEIAMHHVSCDGASLNELWKSIARAYTGAPTEPLSIGYSDLWRWHSDRWATDQTFWATRHFGPERRPSVLPDLQDGLVQTTSAVSGDELRTAPAHSVVSLAVAAAAAAARPLFPSDDVEVCLVGSTRDHELAQPLVGYLLNPLPLQLGACKSKTFHQLATEASVASGGALAHRTYPFARIVDDARRAGRPVPTGQVLVSVQDIEPLDLDGMPVAQRVCFNGASMADLTFFMELRGSEVQLLVEYSARTGRAVAQLALASFEQALTAVVRTPQRQLGSIAISADTPSLLQGGPLSDGDLIVDAVRKHASVSPDEVAVECADQRLSWAELESRAGAVAAHLGSLGVGHGDRVIVRLERSVHLPVVMMGIMAAGGSYVPLPADSPPDRVIERSTAIESAVEIVGSTVTPLLATSIVVDDGGIGGAEWTLHATAVDRTGPALAATDEAYVIFTSGSTGRPNPVAISHGQIAASTHARSATYDEPPTRFAMLSGVGFDSSLVGLIWTLMMGGTVVLPTAEQARDLDALTDLLADSSLSHALAVPTLYGLLLSRRTSSALGWPRHMIVAGEPCQPSLVERHFGAAPSSHLTNEYGPTEATIWATAHHCVTADSAVANVPVGQPIAGSWVAVVDHARRVVPAGVPGELVIGGFGVAAGYLRADPSDKFCATRDIDGAPAVGDRVFCTGDRAVLVNGTIHLFGRLDDQLNIGGLRVEPGEIEAALTEFDGIDAAVVVAVDVRTLDEMMAEVPSSEDLSAVMAAAVAEPDPKAALRRALSAYGSQDLRLVAHVAASQRIDEVALRKRLTVKLGPGRQPSRYGVHDDLPRTPNGKIDRRAAERLPLPETHFASSPGDGTWIERIKQLFCETLHVEDVGHRSSFFDLGGDSLLALGVLNLIEARFGIELPAAAIHHHPTPERLAQRILQETD